MAQSKSFFGLRKGSTKSLTFQVFNGKQITKDRVWNVKNPQTLAQMTQRALMATAVIAYSRMKTICDHSFEGVEIGTKTMSEFIRENLAVLKRDSPELNLTSYKESNFGINRYLVSKGTLVPLDYGYSNADDENPAFANFTSQSAWDANMTYKMLAEKCGLKTDGMLTFMIVTEEGELQWVRLKFTKAIMASETKLTENMKLITEMQKVDADSVEGNTNELVDDILLWNDNNYVSFKINDISTEGVTVIKSQKSENVWRRSTNALNYQMDKVNYELALATYPINTTLLLNGGVMASNVIKK